MGSCGDAVPLTEFLQNTVFLLQVTFLSKCDVGMQLLSQKPCRGTRSQRFAAAGSWGLPCQCTMSTAQVAIDTWHTAGVPSACCEGLPCRCTMLFFASCRNPPAACVLETAGSLSRRPFKARQAYLHEYFGALQERSILARPKHTAGSASHCQKRKCVQSTRPFLPPEPPFSAESAAGTLRRVCTLQRPSGSL